MKSFIKNNLKIFVSIIMTAIIVGSVSVYAASQYLAKDISFTPTNENFKKENGESIENVEDALNELYKKSNSNDISVKSGINQDSGISIQVEKGSYIVISSVDKVFQITNCEIVVDNSLGGVVSGIGSWSSVYKTTNTDIQIIINNNSKFSYYVFK